MPRKRLELPLPRFINPANVEVGDTIRVAWSANGVDYTKTGTVYRRIDTGNVHEYFTDKGAEIMHWIGVKDKEIRVTLLATAKVEHTMLDIFEQEIEHVTE